MLLLGGLAAALLAAGVAGRHDDRHDHWLRNHGSTTSTSTTTDRAHEHRSAVLAVSGHGWGHGLGLSQLGAYGFAKHGWSYDRILAHYYSGTTLGPAKVSTVRVLLAAEKKTSLNSIVAWSVTDATGTKVALVPGILNLKPKLAIAGQPALQPPFTFVGKQPLVVDGRPYRGKIVVSSDGKQLQVVDTVGLEAYLKGVVPSEMPSGWPAEALKAQAVAARSYALANLTKGRAFDLYGDTRSQVYGGLDAEAGAASDAVDATKGQVVLYNGKVADTLFFSHLRRPHGLGRRCDGCGIPYLVPSSIRTTRSRPTTRWGPVCSTQPGRAAVEALVHPSRRCRWQTASTAA